MNVIWWGGWPWKWRFYFVRRSVHLFRGEPFGELLLGPVSFAWKRAR